LSLYGLFSGYGTILDISAKQTEKMREQAFVVYSDIASATTAKRSLNGFTFFSKPLVSSYTYDATCSI
jgi:RNA recognition motif-containing protein